MARKDKIPPSYRQIDGRRVIHVTKSREEARSDLIKRLQAKRQAEQDKDKGNKRGKSGQDG